MTQKGNGLISHIAMKWRLLRKPLILISICFSATVHAEWISDIDKKYSAYSPNLYAKVLDAKTMISDSSRNWRHFSEMAITKLYGVIGEDQKFAPAYVQLARAYSNLGFTGNNSIHSNSLREMESLLNKALAIEPNYDYALVMMGYTKMFQGQYDAAAQYYDQAKSLKTGYPYLLSQMAQLHTRMGQYRKAIDLAAEGYELHKSNPRLAASMVTEIIFAYEKLDGDHLRELSKWSLLRAELAPNTPSFLLDYAELRIYGFGDYETAITYATSQSVPASDIRTRMILASAYYARWSDLVRHGAKTDDIGEAWQFATTFWHPSEDMLEALSKSKALEHVVDQIRAEAANKNIQIYRTIKGKDGMTIYLKSVEE